MLGAALAVGLGTVFAVGLAVVGIATSEQTPKELRDTEAEPPGPAPGELAVDDQPRCSLAWEGHFEPSWHCDSEDFFVDFDGDVCDALREGSPSVFDYVTSWNSGQTGFMYLPERRDSEELLARFALAYYIADEQRYDGHEAEYIGEKVTGQLHNIALAVDAPNRSIQQEISGPINESVHTWVENFGHHCVGSEARGGTDGGTIGEEGGEAPAEEPELAAPSHEVVSAVESYEGLFDVECSRESLGTFADHGYALTEYRRSNRGFFRNTIFYGIGALLVRDDWVNDYGEEGTDVEILVLAGQPGNLNYRHGAGSAQPGDVQRFTSYGGDSMILGEPSPGDLLMWFEDGFAYGWASWREPTSPELVRSELAAVNCAAVWRD